MNNYDISVWIAIRKIIYDVIGENFFMAPDYDGPTLVEVLNTIAGG